MKKFWIMGGIFLGLALLGTIGMMAHYGSGLRELSGAGTAFLEAVKKDSLRAAHGQLSNELQSSMDEPALHAFLTDHQIRNHGGGNWVHFGQDADGRPRLHALLTDDAGHVRAVRLTLGEEGGAWKVAAIEVDAPQLEETGPEFALALADFVVGTWPAGQREPGRAQVRELERQGRGSGERRGKELEVLIHLHENRGLTSVTELAFDQGYLLASVEDTDAISLARIVAQDEAELGIELLIRHPLAQLPASVTIRGQTYGIQEPTYP